MVHVDEIMKLMKTLTDDSKYEMTLFLEERERDVRMCEVMDKVENNDIEKSIKRTISVLQKSDFTKKIVDAIMEEYKLSEEEATKMLQ